MTDPAAIDLDLDDPHAEFQRPRTRGECMDAVRPCPWISCRHHMFLDVSPETGSITLNRPDQEPWELENTCSLDVADLGGGITLEVVSEMFSVTRERIRQIETKGLQALAPRARSAGIRREDTYFTHPLGNESTDTPDTEPTAARISHRERQARYEERKRAKRGNGG